MRGKLRRSLRAVCRYVFEAAVIIGWTVYVGTADPDPAPPDGDRPLTPGEQRSWERLERSLRVQPFERDA